MSHLSTLATHPSGPVGPLAALPTFPSRVLVVLDDTCQAKVGDLTHQGRRDQDVGGSEVSVNVVPLLDERHAFCNLHPKQRHPHPHLWPGPRWVPSQNTRGMSKFEKMGKCVWQLPLSCGRVLSSGWHFSISSSMLGGISGPGSLWGLLWGFKTSRDYFEERAMALFPQEPHTHTPEYYKVLSSPTFFLGDNLG